MAVDYNPIVPVYDQLAELVFGNKLELARTKYLHHIKESDNILIVGGGTGKILESLDKMHKNLRIDFVDKSSKMIDKASARSFQHIHVSFHNQDIMRFSGQGYDVVVTNFFFDNFSEDEVLTLTKLISDRMNPGGLLLLSDFINSSKRVDRVLLTMMKAFFRVTVNLKKVILIDYINLFQLHGFKLQSSTTIGTNLITAIIRKNDN